MSFIEDCSLDELEENTTTEIPIQVKVSRKWNEYNPSNDLLAGVNFIFLDKYGGRMHGWISCTAFEQLGDVLVEQQTYAIKKFTVEPYTCEDKCFDSSKHILLSQSTEVIHLPGYHCEIADSIFRFTNLKRIQELKVENKYLIDVVGIVDCAKSIEICTKSNGADGCFMDVWITDMVSEQVKIRLWDDFAKACKIQIDESIILPPIIILASCKVVRNNYNGFISLSNATATKLYVNENCDRVDVLRRRFWEVNGI